MESHPVTAFILTLVGGLFVLLGAAVGFLYVPYPYAVPNYNIPFLAVAAVAGGVLVVSAVLLQYRPGEHLAWGVIIIVFSVVSAVGAVTGYFALFGVAGLVLGVVGGALAVSWKEAGAAPRSPLGAVRLCHGCGRYVPLGYPYCAFCGTPAPIFHPPSAPGSPPPGTPPQT